MASRGVKRRCACRERPSRSRRKRAPRAASPHRKPARKPAGPPRSRRRASCRTSYTNPRAYTCIPGRRKGLHPWTRRKSPVRQEGIERFRFLPLIENRARDAERAGRVDLVRVKEDLRLNALGLRVGAETVRPDASAHLPGVFGHEAFGNQKAIRLLCADGGVAQPRVVELLPAADVVEQAGGDQRVVIDVAFKARNIERDVQYPVDVVLVVRAVVHASEHMAFDFSVGIKAHRASSPQPCYFCHRSLPLPLRAAYTAAVSFYHSAFRKKRHIKSSRAEGFVRQAQELIRIGRPFAARRDYSTKEILSMSGVWGALVVFAYPSSTEQPNA